jgi:glycosyltransferase involved in cell wall biosynthesis
VANVSLVYRRHGHHSAWSGYPRFAERLDGLVRARRAQPWPFPRRALERASRGIVYDWFGPDELALDLAAARRLVLGRRELVHLLYGETSHYYAGRMRRLGRRRGNRLVATFHQPPAVIDELLPAPPLFEQIDHAIALGPRAAAHLEHVLGRGNVSLAFLGVDTDAWCPDASGRAPEPTCAFVGSWFRDFGLFADVVREVSAHDPTARFDVVTAPECLEALACLPGVRARAQVSDEELRAVYRRAWVQVVPVTDAVANNALLEGMACGLATVAVDAGDVAHYAGEHGALLVPPGDPAAMAEAVLRLLADERARERLGAHGRARAEALDLDAAARRHAEIYRAVGG